MQRHDGWGVAPSPIRLTLNSHRSFIKRREGSMKVIVMWSDGQEYHHEAEGMEAGESFVNVLKAEADSLAMEMADTSAVPVSFELLA
jgi:hypothetical protein